ncbi:phenylalanyl-tRNA synthetase beta subunit [Stella humosa]|uniref:Phenylalanine--tRNA ligase beta subunit n=1 Tax=Stella humosa TaxID=94 RepID=A0A3N1LIH3_9PROT|nr:phenylalanine--tRNA ligase subunit beta [Stella humosa]ROP90638.1 phenylalanyl-tRNA synthetase beta subunit [Stella humosa]BBK29464.1 phenylalanine--tRNA ligase beta subunit [Stella humosa]
MKITLSWLRDHLETDADLATVSARLTMLGHEVDGIDDPAARLAPFTVGYVVSAVQHPNADRLRVCVVDTGTDQVQVVCGAPNARTGMKGVFARAGTVIPRTGVLLKAGQIRGEASNGMLCSAYEMGLSDDHDGIIDLPEDAPVGQPFAPVMGLDDPVLDIKITPNRADCLGIRGLARDLAAAGVGRLKPRPPVTVPGSFASPIGVRFDLAADDAAACPLYAGRYIRGVRNGPSPAWLQKRLLAVGLRPISVLVDITNFFTLDIARPLHVFDADRVTGDILVRRCQPGESLHALNGKIYELDGEMTAIADGSGVVGLGGVIGGETTGCTEGTVNVFVESALFDPVRTAATGRKLGLQTDARYRFERGVDPASAVTGIEAATRMIIELCGGEASQVVVTGREPDHRRRIRLHDARVATLGGLAVAPDESRRILEVLGAKVERTADAMDVEVPSWRADIEGEADLVEEVLRVHGYDAIPVVPLPREHAVTRPALSPAQRRVGHARRQLAARGLVEAVTFSFMPGPDAARFGAVKDALRLVNPISADLDVMRPSILPNLIAAAGRNADRGFADGALFEIGPQYADDTPAGQSLVAAGIRSGEAVPRHWTGPARAVDAYDAKADALAALAALGVPVDNLQTTTDAPAWYHPGRSGVLRLGTMAMAQFGELHPAVLQAMSVKGPLVGFEVMVDAVPLARSKGGHARPALSLSAFQPVTRDFAFLVDGGVAAEAVTRAVKAAERKLLAGVRVFDVYRGPGVPEGRKSIAVEVTLQPVTATLTEEEIDAIAARIVAQVAKSTGGTLRT